MKEKKASVLLVGSGGVGTIASLGLELSGRAAVTSVLRSDYERVKEKGFVIESVEYGDFDSWKPSRIVNSVDVAVAEGEIYDYIMVCMKVLPELYKSEDIIANAVTPGHTVIVLMQNGIGIEKPVAERFPENIVLSGISMIASMNLHGRILHKEHDKLKVGYYSSPGIPEDKIIDAAEKFVDIYGASGAHTEFVPNLDKARWTKLIYNSCINTISALILLDTGRLYLSGLDQSLIIPTMQEIKAIALKALGEPLEPEDIDFRMLLSDEGVYYHPSMMVDVEKGNPIELEVILGNPLRIAKELGVETPILQTVYYLLKGVQFRLLEGRGYIKCPEEAPTRAVEPFWKFPYN
ncbi:hypothetical protein TRVA0_012S01420 [Trichomonascus vanleenenianus]|uniref:ketopantoate reductase family protein n=1 Tax=Trichomonascus vanleenenianus TaxID=2268995 RepID=UPI003EC9A2C1